MNPVKIGLLTIGQSPREDLVPEIKPLFLPHLEIIETGLLDNLDPEEIKRLKPKKGELPLVTRLREGAPVQLSERKIGLLIPKVIDSMKTKLNVRAVGILCTHDFPRIKFPFSVIFPFEYLNFLITRVLNINNLGIVIPMENQIEMAEKKWEKEKIIVEVKSPYAEGKNWKEIAQSFVQKKAEAVILDCIGYTIKDKMEIQSLLPIPILLPRLILVFAINQLF